MITPPIDTECIRLNDVIGRERVGEYEISLNMNVNMIDLIDLIN